MQIKMVDICLLSVAELNWLNDYHSQVWEKVWHSYSNSYSDSNLASLVTFVAWQNSFLLLNKGIIFKNYDRVIYMEKESEIYN